MQQEQEFKWQQLPKSTDTVTDSDFLFILFLYTTICGSLLMFTSTLKMSSTFFFKNPIALDCGLLVYWASGCYKLFSSVINIFTRYIDHNEKYDHLW